MVDDEGSVLSTCGLDEDSCSYLAVKHHGLPLFFLGVLYLSRRSAVVADKDNGGVVVNTCLLHLVEVYLEKLETAVHILFSVYTITLIIGVEESVQLFVIVMCEVEMHESKSLLVAFSLHLVSEDIVLEFDIGVRTYCTAESSHILACGGVELAREVSGHTLEEGILEEVGRELSEREFAHSPEDTARAEVIEINIVHGRVKVIALVSDVIIARIGGKAVDEEVYLVAVVVEAAGKSLACPGLLEVVCPLLTVVLAVGEHIADRGECICKASDVVGVEGEALEVVLDFGILVESHLQPAGVETVCEEYHDIVVLAEVHGILHREVVVETGVILLENACLCNAAYETYALHEEHDD